MEPESFIKRHRDGSSTFHLAHFSKYAKRKARHNPAVETAKESDKREAGERIHSGFEIDEEHKVKLSEVG